MGAEWDGIPRHVKLRMREAMKEWIVEVGNFGMWEFNGLDDPREFLFEVVGQEGGECIYG